MNRDVSYSSSTIGLLLLGVSFSLMAIFFCAYVYSNYYILNFTSTTFKIVSALMLFLFFSSLGITISGLILLRLGISRTVIHHRKVVVGSIYLYTILNIIGLVIWILTHFQSISVVIGKHSEMTAAIGTIILSSIFAVFLLLYSLVISQFLPGRRSLLPVIPAILSISSFYFGITGFIESVPNHVTGTLTMGPALSANISITVSIFSPSFSSPGLATIISIYNDYSNIYGWGLAIFSNIAFAILYILASLRSISKNNQNSNSQYGY